jgi:DHA1 family tetracycline resistance protein-like MFS transporter
VGVAMIVVQGAMMDWMTRTFGLINVLTGGAAIFAASLIAAISVETEFTRGFVIFTAFAGATCCLPVLNTVASSIVGTQERGRMMGVTALAASIGRVIGPLATGLVLAVSDYPMSWFVIALPVFLVLLWSRTGAVRYARHGGLQPSDG